MNFTHRLPLLASLLGLALGLPGLACAATLNVPAQYLTIQAAVNASSNGDTVLIADGTYTGDGNRDISFGGKSLTIASQHGASSTALACDGSSSASHFAFSIVHNEIYAVIRGLTIRGAYETSNGGTNGGGGAVNCYRTNLTIEKCIFNYNTGPDGGAINVANAGGTSFVTDCSFTGNTATFGFGGGAIYGTNSDGGSLTIKNCVISGNTATTGTGGGIYTDDRFSGGTISVENCLITGNTAQHGGGLCNVYNDNGGAILITNCTVTNNTAQYSGGGAFNDDSQATGPSPIVYTNDIFYSDIYLGSGSNDREIVNNPNSTAYATVTHSDIQDGYAGAGNINADPQFVSAADLHLKPNSPCLGAGTATGAPTTDLDGNARPNPPSIGAYELASSSTPVMASGTTHLLWNNTNGTASIWNYSKASGSYTNKNYGPFTGYTAKAIADSTTDTLTRLLWNKTDGTTSIWSLNNAAGTYTHHEFGPFTGYTAAALSVAADNTTHVLWTNTGGTASLWNYSTTNGTYTHREYGPYAGWTARALADAPDGKTRLLWNKSDGTMSLWSLDNATGVFSQFSFGPYSGWAASAVSVGADNAAHILWTNTNGTASVWNYSTANGVYTNKNYGPYAGWTARALADAPDGKTRLLWNKSDGTMSLWSLDNATGVFSQFGFGPYAGWTATGISSGA